MKKTELVKEIAGKSKLRLSDTEKFVDAFINTVSDELIRKNKMTLVGFETFKIECRKKRRGGNPKIVAKNTVGAKTHGWP